VILPINETTIRLAVEALEEGLCIGLPTETVYGLAGDGLNPLAVARIFEAKNRPAFDPLILHVASDYDLLKIVSSVPLVAQELIKKYWPGPLTLILPKNDCVPELVTSGLPSVAVRCPDHAVAQQVLALFGKPLAAPSANLFGRLSPTSAAAVDEELHDRIAMTLDGGACRMGLESTIVDVSTKPVRVLRLGALSLEALQDICGELEVITQSMIVSPGMLDHHYAPQTPLYLCEIMEHGLELKPQGSRLLFFTKKGDWAGDFSLCENGDLKEAAANLFSRLRELDQAGASMILAEYVPDEGLGRAINDRLKKASTGTASWNGLSWDLKARL